MPKPTVLVVDDDSAVRSFLRTLLQIEGIGVVSVASAGEALKFLRKGECLPDLCIVDYIMPDMDGFELLRRLRRIRWAGAMPVLMLTASAVPVQGVLERQGVAYLHKTRSNAELVEKVRRLLPVR